MLSETIIETHDAPAWAHDASNWKAIDRALRSIAKRRAALDADEARWLREAEALQIWRPLGMVSALDYMERVLGYAPRAAQERLRVARALGDLPELADALARGQLAFSAARELTRVATPGTARAWIDAARGKNLRQIEELVAGHRPGDRPDEPADPDVRTHVVRLELQPGTYAAFRQARAQLEDEHGSHLDDDAFVAALAHGALGSRGARAKHTISMVICERCKQSWQHGAGAKLAITAAAVVRAECDAERVGPRRAKQDIPPRTARAVWLRDGGRCRVPGCRSARGLEIHHLIRRADGGTHELSKLILACSACHQAHHDGRLKITGPADQLQVGRAHVGASDAVAALVQLGWKLAIARPAVDAAIAELGDAPLEQLIFEALRRCPRP